METMAKVVNLFSFLFHFKVKVSLFDKLFMVGLKFLDYLLREKRTEWFSNRIFRK